jgi:hypothetical protein
MVSWTPPPPIQIWCGLHGREGGGAPLRLHTTLLASWSRELSFDRARLASGSTQCRQVAPPWHFQPPFEQTLARQRMKWSEIESKRR